MNKKFYFGLALTAGLFASCSSDDVATSEARQIAAIDDNAPAKVELNVGSIGATVETRGTGSVGIAADGTTGYGWAGQKFNAFMLEKGTMKYAHMTYQDATTPFVFLDDPTDATVKNGKGAEFTTPDQNGSGTTTPTPVGLTTGLEVYYPTLGEYDFWAYRLDDAYKGGAITGYDDENADAIEIPFEIDGTQDIMVAAVTPDYTGLTPAEQTECEAKLYSAFTGRRGVKAQLDFKHQLTRLTFKVKAHTKDVSDAADLLPGAAYKGFKVTGISVRSNTTGKLVAASTDANWNSEAAIAWDPANWATPTGLTELQLKSRAYGVAQKANGNFVAINLNTAVVGTTTLVTTYHGNVTVTNEMEAYQTEERNSNTGEPSSAKKTIAEWKTAGTPTTVYFWDEDHDYQPDKADVNINENLQTLIAVQPKWNVAIHTETTLFTVPAGVVNVADDADITTQLNAEAAGDYTVLQTDDNTYYTVTWDGTAVTAKSAGLYTIPTPAPTAVADMATLNATQDDAAAPGVTVFLVGGTKYIKSSVTAAKPAAEAAVATPVGEALMVAPADENGYLVTVYYSCYVKDNATTSHEKTDGVVSKQIVLKKKTGQQDAQPFKAGKQYNITIELFRNATAESTTTVTDWGNDDDNELEDSYEFE